MGHKCVLFKKHDYSALNPIIKTSKSIGIDVKTPNSFILSPREIVVVDTRVEFNIPEYTTLHIANRSSHSLNGILVNVGHIDGQELKNTIKVIMHNTSDETHIFNKGDSIAQLLVLEYRNKIIHFRIDSFFFAIISYNNIYQNGIGLGLIPKVNIPFIRNEIKIIDTRLLFSYIDLNTVYTIHPTKELRKLNIHILYKIYSENKSRLELVLHNRNHYDINLPINREYFRIIPISIAIPIMKEITLGSKPDLRTKRGLIVNCMRNNNEDGQLKKHQLYYQMIKEDVYRPFTCDLYGNEHKYGFYMSANDRLIIRAGQIEKISTHLIFFQIPGYYMHMFTPYNLSTLGLTINGGIIDIDYEGEVCCIIQNHTDYDVVLSQGSTIAFIMLIKNVDMTMYEITGCDCGLPIRECLCKIKKQVRLPINNCRYNRGFGSTGN